MDNLNAGMVARLRLPCPPLSEQKRIMASIASESMAIQGASDTARREIDLFREYRTRLIADVVTGKLDVRGAAADLREEPEEPKTFDETGSLGDAIETTEVVEELEE